MFEMVRVGACARALLLDSSPILKIWALAGAVMAQNSKARMKNCRIIVRVFNFAKVSIIVQISSRMILANQLFFNMCITFQKFAVILPSKHHHFVTISLYDSFGFRLEKSF